MEMVQILLFFLAYHGKSTLSFSHQEVSQATYVNRSSTNCTVRDINSDIKCGLVASSDNRENGAENASSASPSPSHSSPQRETETDANQHGRPSQFVVWAYSIGSAFFISLSGLWGYILLPLLNGAYQDHVMNVLFGLSCGSLITSSLCQLIPEAYELGLLSAKHDYMYISVFSMAGVWFILFAQNFSIILRRETVENERCGKNTDKIVEKKSENRRKCRNGKPLQAVTDVEAARPLFASKQTGIMESNSSPNSQSTTTALNAENEFEDAPSLISQRRSSFQISSGLTEEAKLSKLAIVILAGDFVNNFMDGISIGAGYAYLVSTGLKLTIAISFEEYTHKLGDFAIVFRSGISMKRVLFWNYVSSCSCFLGIIVGIALGNLNWSKYIFSFASGLFLYFALSNMIPEMQNMLEQSLKRSKRNAFVSLIEQHVGFVSAFVALILISLLINDDPTTP